MKTTEQRLTNLEYRIEQMIEVARVQAKILTSEFRTMKQTMEARITELESLKDQEAACHLQAAKLFVYLTERILRLEEIVGGLVGACTKLLADSLESTPATDCPPSDTPSNSG